MAVPGIFGTPVANAATGSGNLTVTPPAGAGGWLAVAHWWGADSAMTVPSGWTQHARGRTVAGVTESNYGIWWSNTPTPGATWNCTDPHLAVAVVGYDGPITIDQTLGTDYNDGGAVSAAAPAVTLAQGALVTRIFLSDIYDSTPAFGYPTGHPTGQITGGPATSDNSCVKVCHVAQAGTGTTGTATFTATVGSAWYPHTHTLALSTTGGGFVESFTDSAGLTDARLLARSLLYTDSAGLTDARLLTLQKVQTDSAGLTDAAPLTRSLIQTDSAGLTDAALVESGKAVTSTDSAGLTDDTVLTRSLAYADSAGLTDGAAFARALVYTDSAGLTDTATPELTVPTDWVFGYSVQVG